MDTVEGTYRFGAEHGHLLLHTSRTGLGRRAGHDLTIEATRWSGQATVGDESEVSVRVEVDSLVVREGTGGIKPLSDSDREEIVRNMRGQKILNADAHPTISFHSTRADGSPDSFRLEGELSIGGTGRPVTVRGEVGSDGRAHGTATVVQSQWGIKPYSAFLGALKLADEVRVEFDTALEPAEAT